MARKLKKIISGGQTGGDFGGLLAGRELKLETGGTAPRGYRTDVGPNPRLKEYGLGEHAESGYVGRTRANVDNADLTIAFRFKASPGTDKTIGYAKTGQWISGDAKPGLHMGTRGKPVLVITEQNIDKAAEIIRSAIGRLNPELVNIAGHREASHPGIEQFVRQALVRGIGGSPEQPKVISTPPAQPKMAKKARPKKQSPAKQIPSDQVPKARPTEAELSAIWEVLSKRRSNRFSTSAIKDAVDGLVASGKIRPQAAFTAKSYAVFAEDMIRQRDEAVDPRQLAGAIQERYFLGGKAEAETPDEREMLRVARTAAQAEKKLSPMDRPRRSLGIIESEEQLIRRSLQTPAGKALAESTIRYQRKSEGRPLPKNPLARLRPRAPRPAEKPTEIKGSTLAEKMMSAKVVGKSIGTRATTKSGKPIFFRFKDSDRGRFYKPETLEKVLGPEGSDVLTGVAPIEKTAYAKLNRASEKGSILAAALLAKKQQAGFKTGERVRESTKTTRRGKVFFDKKTGTFKPVYRKTATGELMRGPGGEPIQETEILTPLMKARKAEKKESRALGRTPSEEAKRAERRERGNRTRVKQVQTVEGAIRRGVEERIRKGKAGPLTAKDAATLKKLQAQELGKYDPEMLDELRRLSRIRTRPETPKTSREIADETAQLRAERNPSPAIQRILRLERIIRAHGGIPPSQVPKPKPPYKVEEYYGPAGKTSIAREIGPIVPAGRVIKLPMPVSSRMGKATRKPIIKRPGKGPGMKEQAFAMLAKRFGR